MIQSITNVPNGDPSEILQKKPLEEEPLPDNKPSTGHAAPFTVLDPTGDNTTI